MRSILEMTSPTTIFRTWPMCSALLGLTLVCSTLTRAPAPGEPDPYPSRTHSARMTPDSLSQSARMLRYPDGCASTESTSPPALEAPATAAATSRGLRRSSPASRNATLLLASPCPSREGSTENRTSG